MNVERWFIAVTSGDPFDVSYVGFLHVTDVKGVIKVRRVGSRVTATVFTSKDQAEKYAFKVVCIEPEYMGRLIAIERLVREWKANRNRVEGDL